MSTLLITDVTTVLAETVVENSFVLVEGDTIARLGTMGEVDSVTADEVINGESGYLAPGFIDLHIHGTGRFLIDNGSEELQGLCRLLPRYGVTGFLPGVCPLPKGQDWEFLKTLSAVQSEGTRIYGFHLEGPFLVMTGALPPEAIGVADAERVTNLVEAAKPYRAVFSISPDFEGILDLIPIMKQDGVPIFMTHTAADVKQTQAAIEAGVRHATHFYDVFPAPPVTEPGVRPSGAVEAVLADERVSVDFILDGEHVDPVAVQMALACKGPDRVCLITDANVGAGLPPGKYMFAGDQEIEFFYPGGPARLSENTHLPGGLAGSGLTLDRAVRNALSLVAVDLPQAVRMASTNPAAVLGVDGEFGQIHEGYKADMVLLNRSLVPSRTWIGGKCVFSEGGTGDEAGHAKDS
jgi:N-acetylglucosamine-6-phosphate deacetylase